MWLSQSTKYTYLGVCVVLVLAGRICSSTMLQHRVCNCDLILQIVLKRSHDLLDVEAHSNHLFQDLKVDLFEMLQVRHRLFLTVEIEMFLLTVSGRRDGAEMWSGRCFLSHGWPRISGIVIRLMGSTTSILEIKCRALSDRWFGEWYTPLCLAPQKTVGN